MADTRRCKAIKDYEGKNDEELTFKAGDVIYVPKKGSGDMWQGVFNGKVGMFPKSHIEDTTVEIKQQGAPSRVRAHLDNENAAEGELAFPRGAVMFVIARENETHFKGVYQEKVGLIPCLKVVDAETPAT
eukprot:m.478308 g.478308  ORF g.478308 m.478308 type:complete len:130 (+) comp21103_c0_seq1:188-577(+)